MIRGWLARRRRQRECPHPRESQKSWLVDNGMRKVFECRLCGKRRTT